MVVEVEMAGVGGGGGAETVRSVYFNQGRAVALVSVRTGRQTLGQRRR